MDHHKIGRIRRLCTSSSFFYWRKWSFDVQLSAVDHPAPFCRSLCTFGSVCCSWKHENFHLYCPCKAVHCNGILWWKFQKHWLLKGVNSWVICFLLETWQNLLSVLCHCWRSNNPHCQDVIWEGENGGIVDFCWPWYLPSFLTLSYSNRLERDALPLFRMLRQKYKPSLDRDPSLDEVNWSSWQWVSYLVLEYPFNPCHAPNTDSFLLLYEWINLYILLARVCEFWNARFFFHLVPYLWPFSLWSCYMWNLSSTLVMNLWVLEWQYLDEIGERFYNVQRRGGMQGMLGDFMKVWNTTIDSLLHHSPSVH